MQVLSCAPAQVRDSFSHYEGGNLLEAWILSYTGRPTKKTHGGRVPCGDLSISGQLREVAKPEEFRLVLNLTDYGVNQMG